MPISPDEPPVTNMTRGFRATDAVDYGAVPSKREGRDEAAAARSLIPQADTLDGASALFRIAYVGMPIEGLPDCFRCGRVIVSQEMGPIDTQSTYILQRPGWIPHFDKTMHRGPVEVGAGLALTLCVLPVTVPVNAHVEPALAVWRDEVRAAIAMVAVMLDDRVAQQEVLEDLVVLNDDRTKQIGMLDRAPRVRNFPPSKVILAAQRRGLGKLATWESEAESADHVAARWYLKAANAGPTPDAIVYLWIALEALAPARGKGRSTDVKGVEELIRQAGVEPSDWPAPDVGRCAGIRGEIVHHGKEEPALLHDGFYSLEAMVRLLLRYRLGVLDESWPLNVNKTNLPPPYDKIAEQRMSQKPWTSRLKFVHDADQGPG